MPIIPFYGGDEPELFAIERAAMDRPGHVIAALNRLLPDGPVLDVGAGDGFTAARLNATAIALEPAAGMRRSRDGVPFVGGEAERLPFRANAFAGAYSTWAYFFTGPGWDPSPGVDELRRVVRRGGTLVVADNAGADEFTSYLGQTGADLQWWARNGFATEIIDTAFTFESDADARQLLSRYLGRTVHHPPTSLTYRVALFVAIT
jgi:SAM-dependent methyltransferase